LIISCALCVWSSSPPLLLLLPSPSEEARLLPLLLASREEPLMLPLLAGDGLPSASTSVCNVKCRMHVQERLLVAALCLVVLMILSSSRSDGKLLTRMKRSCAGVPETDSKATMQCCMQHGPTSKAMRSERYRGSALLFSSLAAVWHTCRARMRRTPGTAAGLAARLCRVPSALQQHGTSLSQPRSSVWFLSLRQSCYQFTAL
jgi:hypothetical protein